MGRFIQFLVSLLLLTLAVPLCAQQPNSATPPTLDRVPPPSETSSAAELEDKGDGLRTQKAYLDSIDYYRAAIKKTDSAVLHNKVGICLLLLRRDPEAKKEFQHAIRLDKNYSEAYSNLGTAYFSERDFDGATREYMRAMQIDPGVFERQPSGGVSVKLITSTDLGHLHYVMAQMYGQNGNLERCRFYLSKANEEGYPIKDALRDNEFADLRKDPTFVAFLRSLKPPSS